MFFQRLFMFRPLLLVPVLILLLIIRSTKTEHISSSSYASTGGGNVLKVFDFNTWGLTWPFAKDRYERFRALREVIRYSDYDIVVLQEVWFRMDYNVLRSSMPYYTYFEVLNGGCSGVYLPLGCSGLIILSRHPIEEVEFIPFSKRGNFWNFDGEVFVGKGLGRARVRWNGHKVDVFTTHLVAYTTSSTNNYFRYIQTSEAVHHIRASNADIKIFGGDINAKPHLSNHEPYGLLSQIMTDAMTERYPGSSFDPFFATFGNSHNTYTAREDPERIDVLMYWASPHLHMRTLEFTMPLYMTRNSKGSAVSLSDHEALAATFLIQEIPAVKRNISSIDDHHDYGDDQYYNDGP